MVVLGTRRDASASAARRVIPTGEYMEISKDLKHGIVGRTRLGVMVRQARDPYAVWDLYAARATGRIHPFVQLANVTGTTYQEILGVAMPGRTVVGGVELLFRK